MHKFKISSYQLDAADCWLMDILEIEELRVEDNKITEETAIQKKAFIRE